LLLVLELLLLVGCAAGVLSVLVLVLVLLL
jgi:hypothetical protein